MLYSHAAAFLAALASAPSAVSANQLRAQSRSLSNGAYGYTKACTALVGIGLDSVDTLELNQTWLSCLTDDGSIHDIEAVCKEWVEEKAMKGKIKSNHSRVDTDGAIFNPKTDRVTMSKFPPTIIPGSFDYLTLQKRQKGIRTVLAVRVITTDGNLTTTEDDIKTRLFGPAHDSLKNHMLACSQNELNLTAKNVPGILGGPVENPEAPEDNSKATCLAMGEGTETGYPSEGDSGNFITCPPKSFFCFGGGGTYGKEFAMPPELPQAAGKSLMLKCVVTGDGKTVVNVNVTTIKHPVSFRFEIQSDKYFMSLVQLKAGTGGGISIFKYPYDLEGTEYYGAVKETGNLWTPTSRKGVNQDISHVTMCVMPKTDTCAHIASTVVSTVNQNPPPSTSGGVITVRVPHSNSEGDSVIRNAVTAQLVSHFGIDKPEDLADFVMYCLPDGAMTTKKVYGFVYSWLSVYSDTYCSNLAAQMRELGHNFGLGPSHGRGLDFGDFTGVMGDNTLSKGRKCFNGAKMYQTGWYAKNTLLLDKKTQPKKMNLYGYIKPLDSITHPTKLLKLERKSTSDYYVMCNWDQFDNSETQPSYKDKVVITRTGFDGVQFDFSSLIKVLGKNEIYTHPRYYDGECDLTVEVHDIDTDNGICEVTVTGCVDGAPTKAPTPAPTAPSVKPTPAPIFPAIPACFKLGELCGSAADCCNSNSGTCVEVAKNSNLNTMLVCVAAGTDPEKAVGPPGPPGGTCNDDGVCGPHENCFSCPRDCNGMLSGKQEDRFCCENSDKPEAPYSLNVKDSRCTC